MAKRVMISGKKFADVRRGWYLTQEEFAQRLAMSAGNVRRLEQSQEGGMQVKNFRRLAELMKLTPDELYARIGVGPLGPSRALGDNGLEETAGPPQPPALRPDSIQPVMEIERFHGVSAARPEDRAGVDRGKTLVPAGSRRQFSVVVDGDCMEPKYRHGDVVIFSADAVDREGIVDGRSYFIQFDDGENTFKRVFAHPNDVNLVVLRCWNGEYPDRVMDRSSIRLVARATYRLVADE
jgi:transcriptional regulator with XRE-family HTH domain